MPSRHSLPFLTAVAFLLSSCSDILGPGDDARNLSRSRRMWDASGFSSYNYVVSNNCFCVLGGVPVEVSVRNGQVISVVYASNGVPLAPDLASLYHDVDGLFDLIDDAIRQRAHRVNALYDSQYGYPSDVFIDYQANAIDEEFGFRVSALTPYR
jgi:hypothetical protein